MNVERVNLPNPQKVTPTTSHLFPNFYFVDSWYANYAPLLVVRVPLMSLWIQKSNGNAECTAKEYRRRDSICE